MNYLYLHQLQTDVSPQMLSLVVGGIIGLAYLLLLYRSSRDNKTFFKTLLIVAVVAAVVYFVADISVLISIVGGGKFDFTVVILAAFHTIELFIFQTHFFDNGYWGFFFDNKQASPLIPWSREVYAYIFIIAFVLACITSLCLIIRAFSRRRAGREWLRQNKYQAKVSHVFFLESEIATILAKDIKTRHPEYVCILVGYPNPEEGYIELSLWEKFVRLFKNRCDNPVKPFDAVVYSKIPLSATHGEDVCKQMNLKELTPFLQNPSCKVYLLSNSEEDNLRCAEQLFKDSCHAEIYCRACREGLNRMYEEALSNTPSMKVHFVDSSYLAVRDILNCPNLLPINFVDKGTDEHGHREGWVSSAFNSMILGFGETGREALGLIFEHAAFVGKDGKKSQFTCMVMDSNMDNLEHDYRKKAPGMDEAMGITYVKCDIGDSKFWNILTDNINSLNYIVVSMGDERNNLKTAVDIVEFAYRSGKDLSNKFVVLVALEEDSHLDEITLKHYKNIGPYHQCIQSFGGHKKVWTYGNVTNEDLTNKAKHFFSAYLQAQGDKSNGDEKWNERDQEIDSTNDYATFAKRIRQRSQDYANCFHVSTKIELVGPEIKDHCVDIAQCIPEKYNEKHYGGNDPFVEKVLRYLAIGEHLRWEASHTILGYTPGEKTDDIKKTHDCIKEFDEIIPEVQHYDYLVIKTTLILLKNGINQLHTPTNRHLQH